MSHYWDCRLKGRPPGTPKSDDPNKRKRKRQARERDLCDVKIKITEYFPGARAVLDQDRKGSTEDTSNHFYGQGDHFTTPVQNPQQSQPFGMLAPANGTLPPLPGSNGERFFTIQRVNGNGGNGKGDGVAGPHKHTLADSDRVKKNSIQRQILKDEKETKKMQVSVDHYGSILSFVRSLVIFLKQRCICAPGRHSRSFIILISTRALNLVVYPNRHRHVSASISFLFQ